MCGAQQAETRRDVHRSMRGSPPASHGRFGCSDDDFTLSRFLAGLGRRPSGRSEWSLAAPRPHVERQRLADPRATAWRAVAGAVSASRRAAQRAVDPGTEDVVGPHGRAARSDVAWPVGTAARRIPRLRAGHADDRHTRVVGRPSTTPAVGSCGLETAGAVVTRALGGRCERRRDPSAHTARSERSRCG